MSRLAVRYLDDLVLLARDRAWAYFRVPTLTYDFLSDEQRRGHASAVAGALAGLVDADCHLLAVPRPYSPEVWAARLDATVPAPAPGWPGYLARQRDHLAGRAFTVKEVYLGVALGRRGPRRPALRLPGRVHDAAGLGDDAVAAKELDGWRRRAEAVGRLLHAGALRAVHASTEELAWLVQRGFHRGLEEPPASAAGARPWGAGELQALAEGVPAAAGSVAPPGGSRGGRRGRHGPRRRARRARAGARCSRGRLRPHRRARGPAAWATRPTFDVDLLPRHTRDNLLRLADALNVLRPRWRVEGLPAGVKIDGGRLESRHFPADATAIGLTTTLGEVDVVIDTDGVGGYDAWARNAKPSAVGGVSVLVAALEDIVASKRLQGARRIVWSSTSFAACSHAGTARKPTTRSSGGTGPARRSPASPKRLHGHGGPGDPLT